MCAIKVLQVSFFFSFSIPFLRFFETNPLCLFPSSSFSALGGNCMSTSCSLLSLHTQYLELFLALRARSSINTCQKERSNAAPKTVSLFLAFTLTLISLPFMILQPFLTVHTGNLKFGDLFEAYVWPYLSAKMPFLITSLLSLLKFSSL